MCRQCRSGAAHVFVMASTSGAVKPLSRPDVLVTQQRTGDKQHPTTCLLQALHLSMSLLPCTLTFLSRTCAVEVLLGQAVLADLKRCWPAGHAGAGFSVGCSQHAMIPCNPLHVEQSC
jgi:membrane-associated PAP2 superfamily phosphatase